jgi:hypothetical protein
VNDQYLSRRAHFEAHGFWPKTTATKERYTVAFTRAPATPATPFKSPEREAWDLAYTGQGCGPLSCRWVQSGAQLRCEWLLPVSNSR